MRNLILLFAKYGSTIVFIILEFICFYLIINYNQSQKEIWLHSANLFSGNINEQLSDFDDYLDLKEVNDSLLHVNAELLQKIINYRIFDTNNSFQEFEKTEILSNYSLIPVGVCGRTINYTNNFMTLCKGSKDGIKKGMGIISDQGIIGIVKNVSENFSKVLLILHTQSRVSSKIKNKEYSGHLVWKSSDPTLHQLEAIPKHANISLGDTILTSGFSTAFPEGLPIGYIENYNPKGASNEFNIDVRLFNDVSKASFVYVVDYKLFEEKEMMEEIVDEQ